MPLNYQVPILEAADCCQDCLISKDCPRKRPECCECAKEDEE